jgi:hypothetical protein
MFSACTKGGGNLCALPDVCLTPAPPGPDIPVPYPNTGMLNQAKETSKNVKFVGKEVITVKSKIPRSMGDEAGISKGIMSGTNMDEDGFKQGSSKVWIEGYNPAYQTSMTAHNGKNANAPAGNTVAPSQIKVMVAP